MLNKKEPAPKVQTKDGAAYTCNLLLYSCFLFLKNVVLVCFLFCWMLLKDNCNLIYIVFEFLFWKKDCIILYFVFLFLKSVVSLFLKDHGNANGSENRNRNAGLVGHVIFLIFYASKSFLKFCFKEVGNVCLSVVARLCFIAVLFLFCIFFSWPPGRIQISIGHSLYSLKSLTTHITASAIRADLCNWWISAGGMSDASLAVVNKICPMC